PLPTLPYLKRLKSLVVFGRFNQSNVGEGVKAPFLRSLDLRGGNVTGFEPRAFPRIRALSLSGGNITISNFPDLELLPQLSDLRLYSSQISEVPSLRGTRLRLLYL